jgi:hypothetical protein
MRQFPLEWPEGFARKKPHERRKHKFQTKLYRVVPEFRDYLTSIGCTDLEISCNIRQPFGELEAEQDDFVAGLINNYLQEHLTGKIYIRNFEKWIADITEKHKDRYLSVDPGVVVRYKRTTRKNGLLVKRDIVLPCDKWLRVRDNLKAILGTIKHLEKISDWGVPDIQERTYEAIAVPALPAPPSCWAILGIPRGATEVEINNAWRAKAKQVHSDANPLVGQEAMKEVNAARDKALEEVRAL